MRAAVLILEAVSAAFLLLFINAMIIAKPNVGSAVGAVMSALLLFVLISRQKLSSVIIQLWDRNIGKAAIISAAVLIIICISAAVFISAKMIAAMNAIPEQSENIIVLGCRIKPNGPSLMLQKRVEAAYEYLSDNPSAICVASGGRGSDEPVSEASCIKDMLVERGIAADRIIVEDRSRNTYENLRFSADKLEENGYERRAVIVTSEFHQLRASIIARKQGYTVWAKSSPTKWYLLPSYWIREWIGVPHEYFIGRK